MRKLSRQSIIVAIVIVVLFLVTLLSLLLFTPKHDQNLTSITDNGYRLAANNNLFNTINILFEDKKTLVNGIYCDGIRTYVKITLSEENQNSAPNCYRILTDKQKIIQDYKTLLGENQWVYIWNSCECSGNTIRLAYSTSETQFVYSPDMPVKCDKVIEKKIECFYEEIYIKSISIAKTSALFDISLYAHLGELNVKNFQIEVDDCISTCVSIQNENNHYALLFPTTIDLKKKIYIHITNSEGILMTIPIEVNHS